MEKPYVHIDNLSVGYHGKALIHDICLDIHKGEIVQFILIDPKYANLCIR